MGKNETIENLRQTVAEDLVYQRRLEAGLVRKDRELKAASGMHEQARALAHKLMGERDSWDRQYRALQSKDNVKRDRIVVLEAQVAVLKELIKDGCK